MLLVLHELCDAVRGGIASLTHKCRPPATAATRQDPKHGTAPPLLGLVCRRRCPRILAASPPRGDAVLLPLIRDRHQMYVCGTEERASTSTPVLRVSMHRSARGTLSSLAPMQPTGEDMRCFVATASAPVLHHPVLSLTSVAGHEVRADATRKVMEMREGVDIEETAMDGDAGVSEYRFPNLGQSRPGTRHTLGGRKVGTGRDTRANLLQGYLLAIAMPSPRSESGSGSRSLASRTRTAAAGRRCGPSLTRPSRLPTVARFGRLRRCLAQSRGSPTQTSTSSKRRSS